MDQDILEAFSALERYVIPLIQKSSLSGFSKEENSIMALQSIRILNRRIGQIARNQKTEYANMSALQVYINNLTVSLKHGNFDMTKNSFESLKRYVEELAAQN
jgi:hypothetical protein